MTDHKRAVIGVIHRLYARIDRPSAKDARIRDIGIRALDELEQPESEFDYDSLNMKDARAAVEEGKISREDALLKEKAGKRRAKLLEWLEASE